MKKIIQKIVSTGSDISTRKALKASLKILGIKAENIDRLYIDIKNTVNRDSFYRIPVSERAVFLPQCLRKAKECTAKMSEDGYVCRGCTAKDRCKVFKIKEKAEAMGYRVFIAPGGSLVYKIIKRHGIKAALGIACMNELVDALESLDIPTQAVELKNDGCVNTDVSLRKAFRALKGA